jgi:hypothetical protein
MTRWAPVLQGVLHKTVEAEMTLTLLDRFRPRPAPQPVFDGLAQLRAYWEALRGAASLPTRAALDPRGLSGVLDRVFLADRIGTGLVQIRLAGSALAEFAGADLPGLPLSCLFTPESRPLLAQSLERVFADPAVVEIDLGSDRNRVGTVMARALLLPLAEEGERRSMLGAVAFASSAAPCKLQILARREERVALPARQIAQPDVFPEIATPEPARRFGHLTLVHFSE